jgi:hypothetical protein
MRRCIGNNHCRSSLDAQEYKSKAASAATMLKGFGKGSSASGHEGNSEFDRAGRQESSAKPRPVPVEPKEIASAKGANPST